uniref:Ig-like domain-containing protein n=1 Tax=Romanomermis culicivorax TaxID=13658 RepID=A0A915KIY4_ROMCU
MLRCRDTPDIFFTQGHERTPFPFLSWLERADGLLQDPELSPGPNLADTENPSNGNGTKLDATKYTCQVKEGQHVLPGLVSERGMSEWRNAPADADIGLLLKDGCRWHGGHGIRIFSGGF